MAVGPDGLLALGGAGGIKEALLGQQHEWFFRVETLPDLSFGGRDLCQGPSNMHRASLPAFAGSPGNGAIERQVDLADAGAVAVALEVAPVT
ncbi:MAG: hypothetical protein H0V70_28470, partial [Ktedonobacteraceae bacterium]|nr:hypothetical protein [Ktedonobacteraceae bacterium]